MRLLLDECSGSHVLREMLVAAGHDVERSIDTTGAAAPDQQVLQYAALADRAVITMNCGDFLGLVKDGRTHPGLLLHYRGAKGGLTHVQIVDAVANVERAFGNVRGQVIALNQYAWSASAKRT